MTRDSVVDEVRAAREAYAARFGFDLTAIGRDLQARERASGRAILAPPVAEKAEMVSFVGQSASANR
jgi:hypothetical protein